MNGEGNFNWRFVLPLEHFYNLTKTEKRLPPILTVQIWDNDLFSPDDFLGTEMHVHDVANINASIP